MDIFNFLAAYGINYQRCDHPAVYTCAEADRLVPELPGARIKSMFLNSRKDSRHLLVVVPFSKRVDLKALGVLLDCGRLSFGSPEELREYLGIDPGAVSLLALVNDEDHAVELIVDREVWDQEALLCHPLVNTSTLVISRVDLIKFLVATGHSARIEAVPGHSQN